MKNLKEILFKVTVDAVYGDTTVIVKDICFISSKVKKDGLFVAINGYNNDGHNFINEAINNGATTIVCEKLPKDFENFKSVFVKVKCSKSALSIVSSNFYDNPSSKIDLIGITGTNGKSTTSKLLHDVLKKHGKDVRLVGNIGNPLLLEKNIKPKTIFVIEASSYQIEYSKYFKTDFAIILNISPNHLERHRNIKNYIKEGYAHPLL